MSSHKRVFSLTTPHGPGGVFFAWQRTSGGHLATTGYDQVSPAVYSYYFLFDTLGDPHLQPPCGPGGAAAAARDVQLLRLGQGRRPAGRHHGQVGQPAGVGREQRPQQLAGHRYQV